MVAAAAPAEPSRICAMPSPSKIGRLQCSKAMLWHPQASRLTENLCKKPGPAELQNDSLKLILLKRTAGPALLRYLAGYFKWFKMCGQDPSGQSHSGRIATHLKEPAIRPLHKPDFKK